MNDLRTNTEAVKLLQKRIEESGLKTSTFALDVLIREPRTIRRWLTGDSPIPNRVREWLQDPQVAPWPREPRDLDEWIATCSEYRDQHLREGNEIGAEYHRGALEAFERVRGEEAPTKGGRKCRKPVA